MFGIEPYSGPGADGVAGTDDLDADINVEAAPPVKIEAGAVGLLTLDCVRSVPADKAAEASVGGAIVAPRFDEKKSRIPLPFAPADCTSLSLHSR